MDVSEGAKEKLRVFDYVCFICFSKHALKNITCYKDDCLAITISQNIAKQMSCIINEVPCSMCICSPI